MGETRTAIIGRLMRVTGDGVVVMPISTDEVQIQVQVQIQIQIQVQAQGQIQTKYIYASIHRGGM